MLNRKLILLCGYARGGTNIAWNMLQSHPKICSPIYETGELFRKSIKLRFIQKFGDFFDFQGILDKELFNFKMMNLEHLDNKYKFQNIVYKKSEIENASLCLKSVNDYIYLTDVFNNAHPNFYYIGLSRNGYSLLDGYLRRGKKISEVAKMYNELYIENKRLSNSLKNFKLIKFEDIIKDPFNTATSLFEFVNEEPIELKLLRFKSKKTISTEGNHKVNFGNEHRKYWVNEKNVYNILDKDINDKQIARLDTKLIKEFNSIAREAMVFYGYEVL